jgi:PAS domain S-box-containing protein
MLDAAMELLDVTHGSIYLLNEAESMIELQYARGFSDAVLDASRRFPVTTSYYPTVYDGKAVFLDDYAKEGTEQFRAMLPELHAMAIIPLVAHDHVIGNYVLSSGRTRPFTDEERAILVAVGQQAGTVVGRLQAEEVALQRATMLDGAHDAIVMWDRHDHITYWNHGAERLYGWTRDEAIGKHVHSLLKTTFPEPLERINSTLSETGRWEGELIHITRENTVVIVESHMTLQHTLDGTLVATLEINNDVTQQRQAEEQLRASSLYARSLLEASLDPLVTISAEGKITDVNKGTEEVTGFSREELIGSDFSNYFTEPDEANAGYRRVFTDGYVRDYPLAIRHRSGSVTDVLYNASLYQNEAGEIQGVFAAARDNTDRKRAEDELQRHSEHLEELVEERTSQLKDIERMAGIGETAAMIGHDLRNPLQGLQYMIDLEKMREERTAPDKRGVDDWEKVAGLLDKIGEQVFYMDKIVGDLQDYARPLRPEREAVVMSALINDVLHSLPHADDVKIVTELSDFTVNADSHLMHRVFANLILNATQAMPKGGTLTVSATTADGSIAVSVHDTGVGIPADMRDKLFSPLTTGKAKGTGLGLAVVKRIVEAHGGTITFESEEGKWTTFTVTLPKAPA